MSSSAFVTGGSGVVGSHLVRTLVVEEWTVRGLARSKESAAAIEGAGATAVKGDVMDRAGLVDAMWGSEIVFHVAGVNAGCPRDAAYMDTVNIEGTVNVIKAAGEAGVRRVVHTSSVSAIGEASGIIGTERTKHKGDYVSAYARSKHLAETEAMETATASGIDLVIVNPSSVQGPGRSTGSAEVLIGVLTSPRPRLFDAVFSIIDIDDCSRGHILAAERGRAEQRYILSGHTTSVSTVVDIVNEITDRSIEPRWVSEGFVRSVGMPLSRLARFVGLGDRVCPDLVRTLLHGHRFDNGKSVTDLGIAYTPLADTIDRTIAWFEAEGLVGT